MRAIQFESIVEGSVIRIPERYTKEIHSGAKVTVFTDVALMPSLKPKMKAGALALDDFRELKLDTRGWKFDREEANERR